MAALAARHQCQTCQRRQLERPRSLEARRCNPPWTLVCQPATSPLVELGSPLAMHMQPNGAMPKRAPRNACYAPLTLVAADPLPSRLHVYSTPSTDHHHAASSTNSHNPHGERLQESQSLASPPASSSPFSPPTSSRPCIFGGSYPPLTLGWPRQWTLAMQEQQSTLPQCHSSLMSRRRQQSVLLPQAASDIPVLVLTGKRSQSRNHLFPEQLHPAR